MAAEQPEKIKIGEGPEGGDKGSKEIRPETPLRDAAPGAWVARVESEKGPYDGPFISGC